MVAFAYARQHPDEVDRLVLAELAVPGLGVEAAGTERAPRRRARREGSCLPASGHFVAEENPAAFLDLVTSFLSHENGADS